MEYPIVPKLDLPFAKQRYAGRGVLTTAGPVLYRQSFGYQEGGPLFIPHMKEQKVTIFMKNLRYWCIGFNEYNEVFRAKKPCSRGIRYRRAIYDGETYFIPDREEKTGRAELHHGSLSFKSRYISREKTSEHLCYQDENQ
ncbi:MAG: hypothetical protein NTV68_07785 [Methanomicrobiales archaeon]|nr:hypothetical protein [Methanomicrobiales archaeon]